MKRVVIALLAAAMICLVSQSASAEEGQVSQDALSAIGLGQMQVMTDQEAQEVRGMGSSVFGFALSISTNNGFSIGFGKYSADGFFGAGGDADSSAGPFFGRTYGSSSSNAYSF